MTHDEVPNVRSNASRIKARRYRAKEILVVGERDPRGADNNIYVWIDDKGALRIRVLKTDRCYKFSKVVETTAYVEVVAV